MKDKRFEEIVGTAFGELEGDLGRMTEAERKELEQYRAMKQGLKSLREVPEHQLSNERLQGAILGSAVKPRRAYGGWGWATAALAATALMVLALQPRGTAEPAQNAVASGTGTNSVAPLDDQASPIVKENDRNNVVASNSEDRRSLAGSLDAGAFQPRDLSEFVPVSFSPTEPAAIETAVMKTGGPAEREALVLVDANSKTRNGAAKATEVTAYGDVVFGG